MRRFKVFLAVLAASALVFQGFASADDVYVAANDVTSTAGGKSVTITTTSSATIDFYIKDTSDKPAGATGSDYNTCDATAASPATVTVNAPSGVTVSAVRIEGLDESGLAANKALFRACSTAKNNELPNNTRQFTFSSSTPSTGYSVTASVSDGFGYYTTANAAFTLVVSPPSNTVPSVFVTGVEDDAVYEFGGVPTAGCSAIDAEDGSSTPAPVLSAITGARADDGLGSRTAVCSYTDASGASATASATYDIVDTTAPVVPELDDVTAEATSAAGAVVTYSEIAANDAVDTTVPTSCSPGPGSAFVLGNTTVVCSATDLEGNTGTNAFTVTVVDTTGPTVTVPAALTAAATSASGAVVTYAVTATDAVDGSGSATCTRSSGSTFPLGTTAVTCSAVDSRGNIGSGTFTVSVQDRNAPVVAVPANITAEATSPDGAIVTFTAAAEDDVSGSLTPVCSPSSGYTFPLGSSPVICTSTDGAENTGSGTFFVMVQDTTAPGVTVPEDITAEATSGLGAPVTFAVSASDAVDVAPVVRCGDWESGDRFDLGETTVTCTATDASGNLGTAAFKVTVRDTTPPTVTPPGNRSIEATSGAGAVANYSGATATDAVDGPVTTSCAPASGSTFALGSTTVVCSATDHAGNTGSASFTVTVTDTTPPVVDAVADVTVEATSAGGAPVSFGPIAAVDAVAGALTAVCSPSTGYTFAIGSTQVTCSATDGAGNTGSRSFLVTVRDTTPPVVTVPASLTAPAANALGSVVHYAGQSATDLVDGSVDVTCTPAAGTVFPLGTTSVTCTAADSRGNDASASFSVTVQDEAAPIVTVPSDVIAEATSAAGKVVTYAASAADNVDANVSTTCIPPSGATFPLGTTAVGCSATDNARNTGTARFNVTVRDTTAPVVTVPASITTEATSPNGAVVNFAGVSATDAVDGSIAPSCSGTSGAVFPLGATTVLCTAEDNAGNAATASFVVTVRDTTAPSITVPGDIVAEATTSGGAVVAYGAPTAHDTVDGSVAVTCDRASGSLFSLGTITVTCTATDSRGNEAPKTFTVTVGLAWSGLAEPPINPNGSSVFKAGSTVPVKVRLTGASAAIADATIRLYVVHSSASITGSDLEAVTVVSGDGGNLFRYDPKDGQYIFNLSTKGMAPGTWSLRVDMGGSTSVASSSAAAAPPAPIKFSLKK